MSSGPARKILILGGTSWLGGRVARLALDRGHEVTCLARGESGAAPDGARFVAADRWESGVYDAVAGEDWDTVLDVSWQPELVRSAVEALGPRAGQWVYVSSASVYADESVPHQDESAVVHEAWAGTGRADIEDYGPAKVACEQACLAGPAPVLVARAGLIAGYGDRSDRFGYWPARVALAVADRAEVLTPALDQEVQVIDVEDLAVWLVDSTEQGRVGTFNALGDTCTFNDVVVASAAAAGTSPEPVPATDDWLVAAGVEPWMGPGSLAMWLPVEGYAGFCNRTNTSAKQAGLRLRPLVETVASALAWERELGVDRTDRHAGLDPAREAELLDRLGADGGMPEHEGSA